MNTLKTSEIRENPSNPRTISKDKFKKLVQSIKDFPEMLQARPIVVDPTFMILGGNMRYKACVEAGLDEVPVYVATWEEAKNPRFIIQDNASYGEWDYDALANDWDATDLNEWGLDLWQEEEEAEGLSDPDEVPLPPEEPKTKLGDLWVLGDHRLLCGDSTKAEDVALLMGGDNPNMVFTDPPYGMHLNADYSSCKARADIAKAKGLPGGKKWNNVIGDGDDFTPQLINTVFACFPDCHEVFLWGADYYAELLPDKNDGSWVVWDKRLEESTDKMYGSSFELCWSKNKHKRDIARVKWAGVFGVEQEHDKKRLHPTQKPTALAEWFFERWGNKGDIVADIYAGSGFTFLAAEKTGRKCYGMELDPKYCDVIVKRWEDFTGKKAHLYDEEQEFEIITQAQ